MNNLKNVRIHHGADVYHRNNKYNLHPENGESCVGKYGIDRSLTFEQVLDLCRRHSLKPDTITKAGAKAKWYLKRCAKGYIEGEIKKSRAGSDCVRRYTLYELDW